MTPKRFLAATAFLLIGCNVTLLSQTTISKSTSIQDGTTPSQKASVSAGGALKVDNSANTQPVSGSVTTMPPNHASTNVDQVNGTTVDTNSGTKSAGTQRVVLATDQPALTNKLLVTPDSVALPAHQSTNVDQVNGTTVDTNSGTKSAGTQRVVLATDQPQLTNALKVDNSAVTQPTSQADPAASSGSITAADAASTSPASLVSGQTLITGTPTASSSVSAAISGVSSFSVQLTGTWVATVQFEKSIDGGTTWAAVGMTGVGSTSTVTSITGTGANSNALLHGNAGNITNVRIRCTAYTSGTVTVKIQPSYGVFKVLAAQDGAPWSGNTTQLGGTAIDTNSGTKSAGTQRVVLATDQPALTNKLLVTPDSVALPAHQSTNVDQVNGTTVDTNSGTKSGGTQRVVLATDQPALTNKLLVTPDSVALPNHQSTNVDQVNGTTVDTNSGTKSAGTQRVVLATDQPALTNPLLVTATPGTAGGWSPSSQTALSNTKTSVKASAGTFGGYMFYNPNSSVEYIQVFDLASGSVTVGTTAPTYVIPIPATSGANIEFANGINHANAIVVAATTTATGSTAPGTALTGFILFK